MIVAFLESKTMEKKSTCGNYNHEVTVSYVHAQENILKNMKLLAGKAALQQRSL